MLDTDARAGYDGCIGSSNLWHTPSRTGVERKDSVETNSDQSLKYGAPIAEGFAVVTFVEKCRTYLGSEPFKLRVNNRALNWLKTYSMDQSYIGKWIVQLDG